jgi:uncharacterized Zn finger protein (UPF0148 family)
MLNDQQWLWVLAGCPRCKGTLKADDGNVWCAECERIWEWEEIEDANA